VIGVFVPPPPPPDVAVITAPVVNAAVGVGKNVTKNVSPRYARAVCCTVRSLDTSLRDMIKLNRPSLAVRSTDVGSLVAAHCRTNVTVSTPALASTTG
jgi:hypothetical protein